MCYTPTPIHSRADSTLNHGESWPSEHKAVLNSVAGQTNSSVDVKFVIIAASPRSASTSIAEEVADHRCSISFNEMFSFRSGDLFHPQGMRAKALGCIYPAGSPCASLKGGCNSPWYRTRQHHMLDVLKMTRHNWCSQTGISVGRRGRGPRVRGHKQRGHSTSASCDGKCVVAVKMFGPDHFMNEKAKKQFDSYASSFEELIAYKGTRVVIVERNAADDECSYKYSRVSNVWHGGNKAAEHAWKAHNCGKEASPQFASAHSEWYAWIREKVKKHDKKALELPFDTYIANAPAARQSLHALAELPAGPEFEQVGCRHTPTLHHHLDQNRRKMGGQTGPRETEHI